MSDLAYLTATTMVAKHRGGEVSPVETVEAALAQIERHNERVNAFCLVDADGAREQARRATERLRQGAAVGLLEGVPVGIKDVFLTAGLPTLKGSKAINASGPWNDDAPVVAALRRHGAVVLGKTTTPELGWKGVTDSQLTGVTRNPWDTDLTAGGSSGGSAAAVALGMGPVAPGTDGGGSVRIPCGFCGLVGLKPTYGRIPLWPPSPFGTLAHAGPMARTVADAALLLAVLAEPDARDWTALPPDGVDYRAALRGGVAGLRIAFSPDLGYVDVDAEVADLVARAAAVFQELGSHVEQVDPGFEDPIETFNTLWYAGAANATRAWDAAQREGMDPGLAEIVAEGAAMSALDYLHAAARRDDLGVRMGAFHKTYDLLLTPTLPIPAFAAGVEVPHGWPHARWQTWTPFTYPFNLTQQPAATVPCGLTAAGLPVGLQIVGAKHSDALVLRAAQAYEEAGPAAEPPPSPLP